jgi:hypothetical protein
VSSVFSFLPDAVASCLDASFLSSSAVSTFLTAFTSAL